ncbi:MAG: hypothetical protein HKO62_06470 [Gammaproteobacteria bacterium]|nr:hypothetical protein [Gammaproteobacteria bacterium]
MYDEDTGEPIRCPFCDAEESCRHRLALLDLSFLSCEDGYARGRFDEFSERIEKAFAERIQRKARPLKRWEKWHLDELWADATADTADGLMLSGDIMFQVVMELLTAAGGEEYPGCIVADGGPGMSSAIALFFAEDPESVFTRSMELLERAL